MTLKSFSFFLAVSLFLAAPVFAEPLTGTVTSVDQSGRITLTQSDGQMVTVDVSDRNSLQNVHPGDQVSLNATHLGNFWTTASIGAMNITPAPVTNTSIGPITQSPPNGQPAMQTVSPALTAVEAPAVLTSSPATQFPSTQFPSTSFPSTTFPAASATENNLSTSATHPSPGFSTAAGTAPGFSTSGIASTSQIAAGQNPSPETPTTIPASAASANTAN